MSKIARKTQSIFALTASDIGQFGSGQLGTKVITTDPSVIQQLAAWAGGWLDSVMGANKFPPIEEMNALDYVETYQLAYLFQEGIPEYDSGTTYFLNSIVKKAGTFQIFGSLADSNVGNALTDATNWELLIDLSFGSQQTVGSMRNAKMSVTAASATATFTADEISVETALGGIGYKLSSFSQAINLATTGAGGMDTGAAPTSGYVALYAIYNPSTNTKSILAVNATSAAAPNVYGGAHMPSGYTASALISVWPTDGTGKFVVGNQIDRTINRSGVLLVNGGAASTPTSFSLASAIPYNASTWGGYAQYASSTNAGSLLIAGDSAMSGGSDVTGISANTAVVGSFYNAPIITAQTAYYNNNVAGSSSNIYASKYSF